MTTNPPPGSRADHDQLVEHLRTRPNPPAELAELVERIAAGVERLVMLADTRHTIPEAPERLPWAYYAPELRTRLKELAERFPADTIADAAAELAILIELHGGRLPDNLDELHGPARSGARDANARSSRLGGRQVLGA